MKEVLYPGSFDPITNGHLDVITRAAKLFDKLLVGVAVNKEKAPLFTVEERVEMLTYACRDFKNVEVVSFGGLLINAVNEFKTTAVIRGLRAVSDFEYEFQMALMNRELNSACETIFMMPSPAYSYVSSRLIKEIAGCGGDISAFVPKMVSDAIKEKVENRKKS